MQQSLFNTSTPTPSGSNDYHVLPATEKQIQFAQHLALRAGAELPDEVRSDRQRLSRWIDDNKTPVAQSRFSNYPSSKQVAFAERIARMKRRNVPQECFRDKSMLSKWIDSNL